MTIRLEDSIVWGATIDRCVDMAVEQAQLLGTDVEFEFNQNLIRVDVDSDRELILRDWRRMVDGCIEGPVGPYPMAELPAEELAHDRAVRDENERRWARQAEESNARWAAKAKALDDQLASTAPIELRDEPLWRNQVEINQGDGYSKAVVDYAERWARLMQAHLAEGSALVDIAAEDSHTADVDGITGFQYGCAVQILAQCWAHGEELRRWHNKETQIGDEGERANESGGVLNPAMLVVGGQSNAS